MQEGISCDAGRCLPVWSKLLSIQQLKYAQLNIPFFMSRWNL